MIKIYGYDKCSTCIKALRWLKNKGVAAEVLPIVDQPPSTSELEKMLGYVGDLKKLFNTSGEHYRALKLGERVSQMSHAEAFKLLSGNGKLVKRPFVLGPDFGFVGFNEDEWSRKI